VHEPKRLFGVCTLDIIRANCFVSESQGMDVSTVNVNVIGGHGMTTILPLLSQVKGAKFTREQIEEITDRVKSGGKLLFALY
jgi:malate/lactate dehydrogenase